ncbi:MULTISPECIES: aldo/keto reductase [unclassified Fusibacter]|uniref:aldo/keto reductase n=1 Tax=unclassified Fusibacter TaxID=2624464 RepID=UPI001013889D|nr:MULTISPECIES: aldo/keto reductase [unclassified Fusibacter]MCK8058977.1 aldo/keto reductase [Fusibacter sp. A2]NPE22388.1 aldo/keto reductase [Fusibacter sp. A1]RXV60494.1 aldo/keto reductase [Fusibacter sp. A1]
MKYRINPKNGDHLSVLGFGCMRFSKSEKDVEEQIIHAIENGVNYFDTAYIYPNSEVILGRVLAKGYRERVKIATKLPPYLVKKHEDFDKLFYTELERLQTTYIDYYLMHMLTDLTTWDRLVDLGVLDWIELKKQSGEIRNIGFSYHGGKSEFIKLIDAYPWEFCMIQYNYLDENNQAGKSGLKYASSKGLPMMIMEPLRGGKLVSNLPKEVYQTFDRASVKRSPAEWAFKWLYNQPEVTTVLSGMNSMEMLQENIRVASETEVNEFTTDESELFGKVRTILNQKIRIPCTGCNYCMPCPVNVDIPTCLACYNDIEIEGKIAASTKYIMQTSLKNKSQNASLCIDCGKCEEHCPQEIKIKDELKKVTKAFEGFHYKPVRALAKRFMRL